MTIDDRYRILQGSLTQTRSQLFVLTQQEVGILNQMSLCEAIFKDRTKTVPPETEDTSGMDKKTPKKEKKKGDK